MKFPAAGEVLVRVHADDPVGDGEFNLGAFHEVDAGTAKVGSSVGLPALGVGQRARFLFNAPGGERVVFAATGVSGLEVAVEDADGPIASPGEAPQAVVTGQLPQGWFAVEVTNRSQGPISTGAATLWGSLAPAALGTLAVGESLTVPALAAGSMTVWDVAAGTGEGSVSLMLGGADRCALLQTSADDAPIGAVIGCGSVHMDLAGDVSQVAVVELSGFAAPAAATVSLLGVAEGGAIASGASATSGPLGLGQQVRFAYTATESGPVRFTGPDGRSLRLTSTAGVIGGDGSSGEGAVWDADVVAGTAYTVTVRDTTDSGQSGPVTLSMTPVTVVPAGALTAGVEAPSPAVGDGDRAEWTFDSAGPTDVTVTGPGLEPTDRVVVGVSTPSSGWQAIGTISSDTPARFPVDTGGAFTVTAAPTAGAPLAPGALSVLAAPAAEIAADAPAAKAGGVSPAARSRGAAAQVVGDCSKPVLFIGARGSGQKANEFWGYGAQTYTALEEVRRATRYRGLGIEERAVLGSYSAKGVAGEIAGVTNWVDNIHSNGIRLRQYMDGLQGGVDEAWKLIHNGCDNQRIILAGYSQGAMVMHRLLVDLTTAGHTSILDRIDGAILIADGDRRLSDPATAWGSARLDSGEGVSWWALNEYALWSNPRSRYWPTTLRDRVHDVCNRDDLVCNPDLAKAINGAWIHTKDYQNSVIVRTPASRAALRALQHIPGRPFAPTPLPPPTTGTVVPYWQSGPDGFNTDIRATVQCPAAPPGRTMMFWVETDNGGSGKSQHQGQLELPQGNATVRATEGGGHLPIGTRVQVRSYCAHNEIGNSDGERVVVMEFPDIYLKVTYPRPVLSLSARDVRPGDEIEFEVRLPDYGEVPFSKKVAVCWFGTGSCTSYPLTQGPTGDLVARATVPIGAADGVTTANLYLNYGDPSFRASVLSYERINIHR